MAQDFEICVKDLSKEPVVGYWSNGILAVTAFVGSVYPSGAVQDAVDDGWTVTHLRSGYGLGGLIPGGFHVDPGVLVEFAEALTPSAPWAETDADVLLTNTDMRAGIMAAARAFWASREREG
jgi:hypothetical protein